MLDLKTLAEIRKRSGLNQNNDLAKKSSMFKRAYDDAALLLAEVDRLAEENRVLKRQAEGLSP